MDIRKEGKKDLFEDELEVPGLIHKVKKEFHEGLRGSVSR